MRRITVILLTIMLMFSIAACGNDGNPSGGSGNGGDRSSQQQDNRTPGSNGGNTDNSTPDNSSGSNSSGSDPSGGNTAATIPDNGTPPSVPAPFETHAGDKGYFFVDTDDYAVFMYDVANNPREKAYGYGACTYYLVVSFDDTDYTTRFEKWVFENSDDARDFSSEDNNRIAIDNVVYINYDPSIPANAFMGVGKEYHININYKPAVWAYGGHAYLSNPAGFEELLADNGLKGKNGFMTLREAFTDAGFTSLPEVDGLDYDAVTDFFLTVEREMMFEAEDIKVFIFEGQKQTQGYRFYFYDDTSKETAAVEYGPFDYTRDSQLENRISDRVNGVVVYISG